MIIFISQTFIKFISSASKGSIPTDLVSKLLFLSIPTMSNFMLPLSLFLAILFSIGSLCSQSEMVVMRSAGLSRLRLLGIVIFIAFLSASINAVCTVYLAPKCEAEQVSLIDQARSDPTKFAVDSGRFLKINDAVVYVDEIDKDDENKMQQIYILSRGDTKNPPSVLVSNAAEIYFDEDRLMWLKFIDGFNYRGPEAEGVYKITRFDSFSVLVSDASSEISEFKVNAKSTNELLAENSPVSMAEFQWRVLQPISIMVLALLVVPMAMVNPRQGRFANFVPAIITYLVYYMLAFGFKSMISREQLPIYPGIYCIPVLFFVFGSVPINMIETELFNKLRAKYKRKRVK